MFAQVGGDVSVEVAKTVEGAQGEVEGEATHQRQDAVQVSHWQTRREGGGGRHGDTTAVLVSLGHHAATLKCINNIFF